jgi:hypothetical protein
VFWTQRGSGSIGEDVKLDSDNELIFIDVLKTKVLKQDSARIM